MGEAVKMPSVKLPKIDLPRPLLWDWIAIASLVVGVVFIATNLAIGFKKPAGEPFPSAWTGVFVFGQLAVACGGLMVLRKTGNEGPGWGKWGSLRAQLGGH